MVIHMSLSRQSDPDLFSLYHRLGSRRFMKVLKETIRASMMGKIGRLIYIPSYIEPTTEDIVQLQILFSSKKDEIFRQYLEQMPSRSRTGYLKTVLRLNLGLSYIRDEFFGINSEIVQAKPLIIEVKQEKIKEKKVNPFVSKTSCTPTPVSIQTPTTIQESSISSVVEKEQQVSSVPIEQKPVSVIPSEINSTSEQSQEDDDIFSMLQGLIDD